MKILVDCRCLNYPFLTGVNSYTIRLLHCLSNFKLQNPELNITAMGIRSDRIRQLMEQFPFLLSLFNENLTLAQYLNYQDSIITQSNWFHKFLEVKLITKNWLTSNLNNKQIERYDCVILPQPRLLKLHPDSRLITIFHDIFNILDNQKQLPQSLIFNKHSCQNLVNRSYKIIAGSISTCQDINKTFFGQNNFTNPKIQLIYPALPNLQELQELQEPQQIQFNDKLQKQIPPVKGVAPLVTEVVYSEKPKFNIPTNPYILAISGIEPRKNWQNLLLAHKHLQQKGDWGITLVLSGSIVDPKYYNKLIKLIKNHQIRNVVWHTNSTEVQKNQLIKNCEFVVYTSYYEGFGFPILEAFEYNKTVVISRISSMPEIGKNACVYANPFSYVSIANCIYLLSTDLLFKAKLEANITKVKSQYSWNEMTEALAKLLILQKKLPYMSKGNL